MQNDLQKGGAPSKVFSAFKHRDDNFIPDRPRDPIFNDCLRFGHLFKAFVQLLPLHVMLLLSVLCKFPATFHPLLRLTAEVISTVNPTSGELHSGNHFRHPWGIPTQPAV